MEWKNRGGVLIGETHTEIRSLRIKDETGKVRRLRTCTTWKVFSPEFTRTPATACLFKTKEGHIGVMVTGRNMGYVKVGKNFLVQSSLFVPFNYLSKKAVKKLTNKLPLSLEEMDGIIIGFEK